MKLFSKNLLDLRKSKGLSQEKLAIMIGKSRSTIAGYEQGWNSPPTDVIIKLAQLFDVNVNFLVGQISNETIDALKNPQTPNIDIYNHISILLELLKNADNKNLIFKDLPLTDMQVLYLEKSLIHIINTMLLFE